VPGTRPRLSLLVATTPRSGSWLLADSLTRLGTAGRPEEYLRADIEADYRRQWDLPADGPFEEFLDAMLRYGQTANGVFSAKLHWFQFRLLVRRLRTLDGAAAARGEGALLQRHLGPVRWVRLERQDTVRQAVSWHRAIVTDQWWRLPGQPAPTTPVGYDFEAVKTLHHLLLDYKAAWHRWFSAHGIDPVPVTYEDLASAYRPTVRRVLEHAGLPVPARLPRPALLRQADEATDRMVAEYRRSAAAVFGTRFPRVPPHTARVPSASSTST
jgi:LPS sulfotransferase NodH